MLNVTNVIFDVNTKKILSTHETPDLADEEVTSYYRSKRDITSYPTDRLTANVHFPFSVKKEDLVGTSMAEWRNDFKPKKSRRYLNKT